ncbi:NAD(P)-dependent oxidoreductase [Maritimibacter sp. DP1N21-5]|uniref:NAD-dependent epimerase/dehydratase family protein n=1 Tax=Maritimibacter sp. DP1N21-5 TaxID=2836867 RepID=UPI001C460A6B|nr:NAD(P)-dependent oxidoreductase [Maritimibacter sp. DP1N21-5]MBV7408543.1 NAD(P)-dependent oxidoreductase [Maritimibacter sp. DP1N21-5]
METPRQVLVTGGAGCLGLPVIRALLDRGHRVRSLDTVLADPSQCGVWKLSGDEVDWRISDLRDRAAVRAALSGCDAVVHAAALDLPTSAERPEDAVAVNGLATIALMEAAAELGVGIFTLISSAAASCKPPSVYGSLKLLAEYVLEETAQRTGMTARVIRPFVIFGPGRHRGISAGLSQACAEAAQGRASVIPFSGLSWFDPLDQLANVIAESLGAQQGDASPVMPALAGDTRAMADALSRLSGQKVTVQGPPLPAFRPVDAAAVARDALALERALSRAVENYRRSEISVDTV